MVFFKQRAIFEKQVEMTQEVIAISQAKNCPEKDLWPMALVEYYGNLASFIKFVEERDKKIKKE